MKQPQTGNKSFILLGLTFLLGAFLTIICSNNAVQRQDDFTACELVESVFNAENIDADAFVSDFETIATYPLGSIEPFFFINRICSKTGNSFVPIFSVSRSILYCQLQLHH
jgi:hypothetical protein